MNGALSGAMLALLAAFMTYMLKSLGFDGGRLVSVVGIVLLLCGIASGLSKIVELVRGIMFIENASRVLEVTLKMLGIGYVYGTVSDICREMGEIGLANTAEGLGRVEILVLTAPFIGEIIGAAKGLLEI